MPDLIGFSIHFQDDQDDQLK